MDRQVKSESPKSIFEILREKKIAAVLATGVGIAALAGCAPSGEAKPTATQSQSPSPEATTEAPVDTKEAKQYTDDDLFDLMSEPLPEALAPYETMPVADFEKLPIEERLSYCSYLNRDQDYKETVFYEAHDNDARYLLPDTFDKDTSAQDIIGASGIFTSAAMLTHFGGKTYDRDTSQKLLSCGWYAPSSENPSKTYKFWSDARSEATVIGTPTIIAESGLLNVGTATGEQPSTTVTTTDGKEYFARTISSDDTQGNSFEQTFLLVDYVDYKNTPKSIYVDYDQVVS